MNSTSKKTHRTQARLSICNPQSNTTSTLVTPQLQPSRSTHPPLHSPPDTPSPHTGASATTEPLFPLDVTLLLGVLTIVDACPRLADPRAP